MASCTSPQLANTYVKDPHEVVKAGDIVKVNVIEVDIPRKRIALSMRMDDTPGEKKTGGEARGMSAEKHNRNEARRQQDKPGANNAFAAAFAAAQNKKR